MPAGRRRLVGKNGLQRFAIDLPRAAHIADETVGSGSSVTDARSHARRNAVTAASRSARCRRRCGPGNGSQGRPASLANRQGRARAARIVLLGRMRAELDVDEHRLGCGGPQHLQQSRMMAPRPGPLVQGGQARGVDADDDDVAVALMPEHGRTRLGHGVLDARKAAGRMQKIRACEDGQHAGWPGQLPKADHLELGQGDQQTAG